VQLGLENKKQTTWAAVLGVVAVLAVAYEILPMFFGPTPVPSSSAQAAAPTTTRAVARPGVKGRKVRPENLDPTLRLDLLASAEQTQYEGSGRNIFVSEAEVVIPPPIAPGSPDGPKAPVIWTPPVVPQPQQIPLKFFGFASKVGEPKKVFLSQDGDVFVAGEGEIVNRRYKVIRISPTSVEMQDMVSSGPPQNIPLTQG
jgi:hypothetical protein